MYFGVGNKLFVSASLMLQMPQHLVGSKPVLLQRDVQFRMPVTAMDVLSDKRSRTEKLVPTKVAFW